MKLKLLTIFPSLSKNSLLTTPLYKVPCTACDWLVLSFKFPRASVNQLETLQVPKIFIYRSLLSFCLQGYWFRRDDTMREDSTDSHRWKSGHHWFIRTDNSITGRDDPCSQRNGKTRFQDSTAYWRSDNVKVNLTLFVQVKNWGPTTLMRRVRMKTTQNADDNGVEPFKTHRFESAPFLMWIGENRRFWKQCRKKASYSVVSISVFGFFSVGQGNVYQKVCVFE